LLEPAPVIPQVLFGETTVDSRRVSARAVGRRRMRESIVVLLVFTVSTCCRECHKQRVVMFWTNSTSYNPVHFE
jgi:hypothetical protein